jgi:chromosome segregation ATPase
MKIKIAIVILVVACIGLGIALFATKKSGDEQHAADVTSIIDYSNQVVNATVQLNDFRQTNLALTNDLAATQRELANSQHELALREQQAEQLSNSLAAASASLHNTKTSLATAQDQIASLNTHITDLEAQNKDLDQRAAELTNTIAQLTRTIEKTQSQLALAETNRVFIEQELKKQMSQKAELEHRFNDINEMRAQVKKLRDEMFVARRLQLMKNDTGSKKGAELLMRRTPPASTNAATKAPVNYDLNVEVGSDGSVRVIPPFGATTNSAAH